MLMAVWKIAPILAAGNCVVLKPAEQAPLSCILLAQLFVRRDASQQAAREVVLAERLA